LVPVVVFISITIYLITVKTNFNKIPKVEFTDTIFINNYPDIILITADGLDAEHMSSYGYSRITTPNIQELMEYSLVAKNAYKCR